MPIADYISETQPRAQTFETWFNPCTRECHAMSPSGEWIFNWRINETGGMDFLRLDGSVPASGAMDGAHGMLSNVSPDVKMSLQKDGKPVATMDMLSKLSTEMVVTYGGGKIGETIQKGVSLVDKFCFASGHLFIPKAFTEGYGIYVGPVVLPDDIRPKFKDNTVAEWDNCEVVLDLFQASVSYKRLPTKVEAMTLGVDFTLALTLNMDFPSGWFLIPQTREAGQAPRYKARCDLRDNPLVNMLCTYSILGRRA